MAVVTKQKLSPARKANLDQMAEVLYDLGGKAHGQLINETMGICAEGERSAAGDALYRDAKGDPRFVKPESPGKAASWALSKSARAQITKARKA